jgi:hypothetical protein
MLLLFIMGLQTYAVLRSNLLEFDHLGFKFIQGISLRSFEFFGPYFLFLQLREFLIEISQSTCSIVDLFKSFRLVTFLG